MIKTFRHKGLKLYFETGSTRGIQANHAARLRMQLAALNTAMKVSDLDIPGYRLHPLKGVRKNIWSIVFSIIEIHSFRNSKIQPTFRKS